MKTLEKRMKKMLNVCKKKNVKLNPDKLQLGRKVTFGGIDIETCKGVGDTRRTVYLSTSEEKLQAFFDLQTPQSKTEVQRICGMAAQMKKFEQGLMFTFPLMQKLSAHNTVFTCIDALQAELDNIKQDQMVNSSGRENRTRTHQRSFFIEGLLP